VEVHVFVRKAQAGADSYGNRWPVDGHVLDLPRDQGIDLLAIPDGGFSEAPDYVPPADPDAGDDGDGGPDGDKTTEIAEPAPPTPTAVTEPAPRRGRKPAAKPQA
jgi:hypothetical protein